MTVRRIRFDVIAIGTSGFFLFIAFTAPALSAAAPQPDLGVQYDPDDPDVIAGGVSFSGVLDLVSRSGATPLLEFLDLTNARDEKAFFPVSRMRTRSARIVVGLDGTRDPSRATDLHHTARRYTWIDVHPERVDMARPLGAFLHFPGEEPSRFESRPLFGRNEPTTSSFALVERDRDRP